MVHREADEAQGASQATRSNQGRGSWSVGHFERRAVLRSRAPMIADARGGDVGVTEPFLRLGDIGLVIERVGGGGRAQRMRADLEADLRRIDPHEAIDAIRGDCVLQPPGAVVAHGAEQRAALVEPMPGGVEIVVDQPLGAWMQRQIAGLAALAGGFQVRDAFARVPKILDLQLAQLIAPQRMEQQRRQDGAVAPALDGVRIRRGEQVARRWSPIAGVLPQPLSVRGRSMPLTGLWVTAFFSQRYSNSEASEANRCRIVAPPRPRRRSSSRQAIRCARVTVRNSSGRKMPAKRTKSFTAFS